MKIDNHILKHYLKNCYFINGTAYAGKSTMCRLLSEKYGLLHMEENYETDRFLSIARPDRQRDFTYFLRMKGFEEYVMRPPEEFERWLMSVSKEVSEFEIAHLISVSRDKKVIVDTNLSPETLKRISAYNRTAFMLSEESMSVQKFFDRMDPEKNMILRTIRNMPNAEEAYQNFRNCIARVNSRSHFEKYQNSGFFTLLRKESDGDTKDEVLSRLSKHFLLDADAEIKRAERDSELSKKLALYAENCSWIAGKHLTKLIAEDAFTDWERPFAAIRNGQIIGFATVMKTDYYPENRYSPWISSLFVDESMRGRGIAGKLIEAAEDYLVHLGFNRAYIPSDMPHFYEKFGYKKIDTLVNYAGDTDSIYEKVIYYED
ncbi:MAG: GNAT family N-acetyltransferase [Clostridia bacterium]|nr:GNAT family N-acetyltransferase [Clostridia bacterium]